MTYRKQASAIADMEQESLRAIDVLADKGSNLVARMWNETRMSLQSVIMHEYREDFGRNKWDMSMAVQLGTLGRIHQNTYAILTDFHRESAKVVEQHLNKLYKETCLRQAWMLDNATPSHIRPMLPNSPLFKEASNIKVYKGPSGDVAWKVRWSSWVDAYASALAQNINLGANSGSSMEDAADEVDATRAGSPAQNLWSALDRVYRHQAVSVQSMATRDVAEANPDMELEEIWMTREDLSVCDECDVNQGYSREEAIGYIPLHPHCNCYYRLVPAAWAKLLRSGDADSQELARVMDAKGLVPTSMITFDKDGKAVAATMVKFGAWQKNMPLSVTSN